MKHFIPILILLLTFLAPYEILSQSVTPPELEIKGKKCNKLIVDRIPEYGDGKKDGCVVGEEFHLNIEHLSDTSIIGRVSNVETMDPAMFVQVKIYNSTDTLHILTNEHGDFNSPNLPSVEKIELTSVGYRTLIADISEH